MHGKGHECCPLKRTAIPHYAAGASRFGGSAWVAEEQGGAFWRAADALPVTGSAHGRYF